MRKEGRGKEEHKEGGKARKGRGEGGWEVGREEVLLKGVSLVEQSNSPHLLKRLRRKKRLTAAAGWRRLGSGLNGIS